MGGEEVFIVGFFVFESGEFVIFFCLGDREKGVVLE